MGRRAEGCIRDSVWMCRGKETLPSLWSWVCKSSKHGVKKLLWSSPEFMEVWRALPSCKNATLVNNCRQETNHLTWHHSLWLCSSFLHGKSFGRVEGEEVREGIEMGWNDQLFPTLLLGCTPRNSLHRQEDTEPSYMYGNVGTFSCPQLHALSLLCNSCYTRLICFTVPFRYSTATHICFLMLGSPWVSQDGAGTTGISLT